jgi:hypothetical protein
LAKLRVFGHETNPFVIVSPTGLSDAYTAQKSGNSHTTTIVPRNM